MQMSKKTRNQAKVRIPGISHNLGSASSWDNNYAHYDKIRWNELNLRLSFALII